MQIIDLTTQLGEPSPDRSTPALSKPAKSLVARYEKIHPAKAKQPSRRAKSHLEIEPVDPRLEAPMPHPTPSQSHSITPKKKRRPKRIRTNLRKNCEKQRMFRERRKTLALKQGIAGSTRATLFERLMKHVAHSCRRKLVYTRTLAELTARVGCAPSAGGARAPLAGIIKSATCGSRGWIYADVPFFLHCASFTKIFGTIIFNKKFS